MKKILLPTDFSDNSWNAIEYALNLFKNDKCVFYVLNTYTPVIYHVEYDISSANVSFELADMAKKESEKNLEDLVNKMEKEFKNTNHTFSQISSFNTLQLEIKELQEDQSIDLIVMGTKGASGLKEVLFGSNTVHVIKNATCPVLAIPSEFTFETPHEILLPSDYEIDFKEEHVNPVIDIATAYNARVHVLNVSYGYDLSEQQEKNRQKIEHYFKNIAHLFHSVSNQDVPEAISNFQLRTRINLLAMINNKHSFFENLFFRSNINKIGFHLNVPFLVIPSKIKS